MAQTLEPPADLPDSPSARPALGWGQPIVAGLLAVFAALVTGTLVAELLDVASPLTAVGDRVVDIAPTAVREFAISVFGTTDKVALQIGTAVVLSGIAIAIARLAARWRPAVWVGPAVLAVVGMIAADVGRDGFAALIPPILGGAAAAVALAVLTKPRPTPADAPAGFDRRDFLVRAAAVSTGAAFVAAGASVVSGGKTRAITAEAEAIDLPTPIGADAGPVVPAGASIGEGVEPFITPSKNFYRIDTALVTPRVSLDDWRLKIGGRVDHPLELSFDDLLSRRVVERVVTLTCVSNEVGGDLIGNATWLGVPLADLLEEVGVQQGADQLASTSVDGWTCGFPTEVALDGRDALVAFGMNGEPLPQDHGFPARLVVPGLYGYVSATKWLNEIELTTFDDFEGYWIPRGWAVDAPIKTQSRIDVPKYDAELPPGDTAIAGVAWAQHRGITGVEVRIDDGEWEAARLAVDVTPDAWRQWVYVWSATPGDHKIAVRATDATGFTQTEHRFAPVPDGAEGWHTIEVHVDG